MRPKALVRNSIVKLWLFVVVMNNFVMYKLLLKCFFCYIDIHSNYGYTNVPYNHAFIYI